MVDDSPVERDAMNTRLRSAWEDWIQTYSVYSEAGPRGVHPRCPECGEDGLDLVYSLAAGHSSGPASIWCDCCRNGIVVSHATVVEGFDVLPLGGPDDERRRRIPNYRIVR